MPLPAHFPDADALFAACSGHFFSLHPRPDPATWESIADPDVRLGAGLAELYAWYEDAEPMLSKTQRDLEYVPASMRDASRAYAQAIDATLLRGRPERGRVRARVAAAIGHATAFLHLAVARSRAGA